MLPRPGVTQNLARFVVETRWEDIPEQARHEAKRALLNFFAVAIAGCRTEPVELALKTLAEFSGGKQATIVGRTERIDALSAAFLNAAGANVFDYCDTHLPTVVHPTAPLAPALLALAELRRVTGPELLLAFVLGFEIECRVGGAVSPGHYPKGWHITSTCGVFGSAAGAAKLLGLKENQVVWALGNASTQSAGLCECLGWPAKSVSVGNAARNGLFSALLAEKGFAGPAEPIAGAQGFLAAMGEPPNWAALTEGLGETWEVNNNSLKPYPAGFVIHPLLDCALDWRRQHPGASGRKGRGARQSPAAAANRPARGRDRPRIAGQPAARRRRGAGAGQGGARSVHRRLRQRSRRPGDARQVRGGGRSGDLDDRRRDGFLDQRRQEAQRLDPGRARQLGEPAEGRGDRAEALGRGEELAARPRHPAADRCGVGAGQERRCLEPGGDDRAAMTLCGPRASSATLHCCRLRLVLRAPESRSSMSAPGVARPQRYSTVTFAAAATAFQMAMSFWMKAANSSGVLPTVCIA